MVYTMKEQHATNIRAIGETWASYCDGYLAFSTANDPRIPAILLPYERSGEYGNMWQKVRSIWKFVGTHYYLEDFDFSFRMAKICLSFLKIFNITCNDSLIQTTLHPMMKPRMVCRMSSHLPIHSEHEAQQTGSSPDYLDTNVTLLLYLDLLSMFCHGSFMLYWCKPIQWPKTPLSTRFPLRAIRYCTGLALCLCLSLSVWTALPVLPRVSFL